MPPRPAPPPGSSALCPPMRAGKVGRNTVTSGGPVTATKPIPCYRSSEGLFSVCLASGNQRRSCYRSRERAPARWPAHALWFARQQLHRRAQSVQDISRRPSSIPASVGGTKVPPCWYQPRSPHGLLVLSTEARATVPFLTNPDRFLPTRFSQQSHAVNLCGRRPRVVTFCGS